MLHPPPLLLVLALVPMLASCAGSRGDWPSLAHRPGETAGGCCAGESPPVAAEPAPQQTASPSPPSPAQPAPPVPAIDLDALAARLAAARDGWARQRDVAASAVDAAARPGAAETTRAAAEIELTRLERYAAEMREIADAAGVVTSTERSAAIADAAREAALRHDSVFNTLRAALAAR